MVLAEVVFAGFISIGYVCFILLCIYYIAIRIKEKYVNFKYKGTKSLLLGGILSKINTTPTLMATISLTFLGAFNKFYSFIRSNVSDGLLGYLDYRVPFDIELRSGYLDKNNDEKYSINKIEEIPKFQYSDIINYIKDYGVDIDEYEEVEKYFLNEEDFYKKG